MNESIWPAQLRQMGRTPARMDGRIVVMSVEPGQDIGPIIHVGEHPGGLADLHDRLAAVLAGLGRTDTDGEAPGWTASPSLRTKRVNGIRLVALEMPMATGILEVDDRWKDGEPWVAFRLEGEDPMNGALEPDLLQTVVHDATLEPTGRDPDTGQSIRRWETVDRDRFLHWIGATPLETAP